MAAEYQLPLLAEGAVTAPTGIFPLTVPTAETQTFLDVGPASVLEIPEFGWAVADGVNPLRLVTKGNVYDAGGIAPNVSMTLTPTAVRATATMTFTAATRPNNNDQFSIRGNDANTYTVSWKDTLSTSGNHLEVKRGATLADCISNLASLVNGTGVDGTNFYFHGVSFFSVPYDYRLFADNDIEISATTATVVTFRATIFGTAEGSIGYDDLIRKLDDVRSGQLGQAVQASGRGRD